MTELMLNENYGEITPSLNRTLKRYNVPPAFFWELEDMYEANGRSVDHAQMERFIKAHSKDKNYQAPWPLRPDNLFAV